MAPKPNKDSKDSSNRWGFFSGIGELLSHFPQATFAQKMTIVAMGLFAALFVGLGTFGSLVLPAWAVVTMFIVAALLILAVAGTFLLVGREATKCRHVPIVSMLDATTRGEIKAALAEIRADFLSELQSNTGSGNGGQAIADQNVRANIFLLAKVSDGEAVDQWRLVMDNDFMINMNTPSERDLKFSVGQGATGISYRDSTYQLSRIVPDPKTKGSWDQKYQLTAAQVQQINPNLRWIYSLPLKTSNASEAVGVLNIDGLEDISSDDVLNACATKMIPKVTDVAKMLSLLPSSCVGRDELGVMKNG